MFPAEWANNPDFLQALMQKGEVDGCEYVIIDDWMVGKTVSPNISGYISKVHSYMKDMLTYFHPTSQMIIHNGPGLCSEQEMIMKNNLRMTGKSHAVPWNPDWPHPATGKTYWEQ